MLSRTLDRVTTLTRSAPQPYSLEVWFARYLSELGLVEIPSAEVASAETTGSVSSKVMAVSTVLADSGPNTPFVDRSEHNSGRSDLVAGRLSRTALLTLRIALVGFITISFLALALFGLVAFVSVVVSVLLLTLVSARLVLTHRRKALAKSWPAVLDHVARSLRSGSTLPEAIKTLPDGAERALLNELKTLQPCSRQGLSLPASVEQLSNRLTDSCSQIALAALHLCACDSAIGAQPIDGAAKTLRDNQQVDREVQALISQSSLSMIVLTLLPFAGLALGSTGSGSSTNFLFVDSRGRILLGVAVILDIAGWIWMRQIIRGVTR